MTTAQPAREGDGQPVTAEEVGRWYCEKCRMMIVASGPRVLSLKTFGALMTPCPWDCGAFVNRSFRHINPGQVKAYRADEWDKRDSNAS